MPRAPGASGGIGSTGRRDPMASPLPIISAAAWNATGEKLARKLSVGFAAGSRGGGWRHPWHVRPVWSDAGSRWEADIFPAFLGPSEVDGPPVPWSEAAEETRERLGRASGSGMVRPWLSERVAFGIHPGLWRPVGSDAAAGEDPEPVPEYFRALGVGGPPLVEVDPVGWSVTVTAAGLDPESVRFLRAVDLVLRIPRPAPDIALTDLGGGITRADVALRLPDPAERPSVSLVRRFIPGAADPSLLEQVAAGRAQPAFQEVHLASVWLLSPPGIRPGGVPGADWVAFVRHEWTTWSAAFAWRSTLEALPPVRLDFSSPVAGGLGNPIFADILAPVNAADEAAAFLLSRADVASAAWTV